jgi:hypothetical protein
MKEELLDSLRIQNEDDNFQLGVACPFNLTGDPDCEACQ